MSTWRVRTALGGVIVLALVSAGFAAGILPHRTGYTVYARVERMDGTYRNMLIDNGSLDAMRNGQVPVTSKILMESFAGKQLTSVFIKRLEQGEWAYGAIRPGESIEAFRPGPHCASCHRSVSDRGGMFTRDMLRAFVANGEVQKAFCELPGRSPCGAMIYGGG